MNKNMYSGRLTRDPEVKFYEEKKMVVRFTLAVSRKYKNEADFIPCAAFGKTAEIIDKHVKKGTKILVIGQLRNNDYEKDGKKVRDFQIIVDEIEFLEKKSADQVGEDPDKFMNISDEEMADLPFR